MAAFPLADSFFTIADFFIAFFATLTFLVFFALVFFSGLGAVTGANSLSMGATAGFGLRPRFFGGAFGSATFTFGFRPLFLEAFKHY